MGIYKRTGPRGVRWWIRWWHHGVERRESAGPTKQHAIDLLAVRRCQIADARRLGRPWPDHAPSLSALILLYLESRRALGRRSVHRMEQHAEAIRRDGLGATHADALTTEQLERYAARRRDVARLAPGTVNRELALVRASLRRAADDGIIQRVPRVRLLREPPGRLRWLSADEEARLLAACRPALRRLLTVAVNTGCRAGELRALTWNDVNRELRIVRVERSKSGERREVPLNSTAEAAIGERPDDADDADPVFTTERGAPWKERNLCARVVAAAKRAGLPGVTAHTLRHTAASRIVQRTGSVVAVRDLLGHSSLAMASRYSHLAPGHLREAVDAIMPPGPDQEPDHEATEQDGARKRPKS